MSSMLYVVLIICSNSIDIFKTEANAVGRQMPDALIRKCLLKQQLSHFY